MSAWIAMVRVDENNGPLIVQPGSHRRKLITKSDVPMTLQPGETYELQQHNRYFPAVKQLVRENGNDVVQVLVNPGDVVLFDGKLIHGGAKVLKQGTRRHALACHYIPYASENWERGLATVFIRWQAADSLSLAGKAFSCQRSVVSIYVPNY